MAATANRSTKRIPRRGAKKSVRYGRGTGVPHPVDVEIGARIRARRLMLGMPQTDLAARLGIAFQQLQKYEGGVNRVSASRLTEIAATLEMPPGEFFRGIGADYTALVPEDHEIWRDPQTQEMIRHFYAMDEGLRERFLDLV